MPGGAGFITAAHLTSLGESAALVARIGTDPLSAAIAPVLADSGVELRWLEHANDAGPQPTDVMVQDGERSFISRRADSARPATLRAALADPAARHLQIAEFATLAEVAELVSSAKLAGLSVSLDPSWDDAWIRHPDRVQRAASVDIFLPNAAEAHAIAACEDSRSGRAPAGASFSDRHHQGRCGGGALVSAQNQASASLPREAAHVLDTTGAGDAFNAGFLAASLAGRSLARALTEGIVCGTLSVQGVGGVGVRLLRERVAEISKTLLKDHDRLIDINGQLTGSRANVIVADRNLVLLDSAADLHAPHFDSRRGSLMP
jgi:sugar/nucleoside kinase (ribokinase family)